MKKNNLFLAFFLLFATASIAQDVATGRVILSDGTPLAGANVIVKKTKEGTKTDANGNYSLPAPKNSVLVISYVGYVPVEVTNSGEPISSTLKTISSDLGEVVVVGYGTAKKATVTGAITSIKGKELTQSPAANLSNNLAGRLPGLTVVTRSGEPGNDASILRIRGLNSIGNNSPLVIVDGIAGRNLERLDPNSIESLTVLKDASAAIYGAQAANGVILITTKRGRTGKPTIVLNINYGWNQPTQIPQMASAYEYAVMYNEYNAYNNLPLKYTDEDLRLFQDGSDPWGHPNTDFFAETFKPWSSQNYKNLTVRGGSESVKYFFSVGSRFQDGNFNKSASNYKQTDFVSNIDTRISKNIDFSFDILGRLEDRSSPSKGVASVYRGIFRGNPTLPAYWPDGKPGPDIEAGDNPVVTSSDLAGYSNNKSYVFQSNLRLNITVPGVKGLKLQGNASYDKTLDFSKTFIKPVYLYTWNGQPDHVTVPGVRGVADPRLTQRSSDSYRQTFNFLVTYERRIGEEHTFKILSGTETQKGMNSWFSAFRRNFRSDQIDQLFAGGNDIFKDNLGGAGQFARVNYFGRANYDFREKYLLEFVWRYDGSYIFSKGKQYGFFPGVSAGWRVSEEKFFKDRFGWINNFKLRGSWGRTGNDRIAEFQYLATFGLSNANYAFAGQPHQIMYETKIPNPNVTWEVASQANIGFDAELFNSKWALTFDFFNNVRSNILIKRNASAPEFAGLTLPPENIGKVGNKGFEAAVSYFGKAKSFDYTFSVNGGYSKNKVLFWDEEPNVPEWQRATGRPIPSNASDPKSDLYYEAIGIFADERAIANYPHVDGATPGSVVFKDVNEDGLIDDLDRIRSLKNNIPTFTGGISMSVRFKQLDFVLLLQGALGGQTYFAYEAGLTNNYTKADYDGRWTVDNVNATKSRAYSWGTDYWTTRQSTYNLRKTDYLRLKNLELGYTFADGFLKRGGLENVRLFVSGANLLTWDKFPELDPEIEQNGAFGYNYFIQRVVNAGLSVNF